MSFSLHCSPSHSESICFQNKKLHCHNPWMPVMHTQSCTPEHIGLSRATQRKLNRHGHHCHVDDTTRHVDAVEVDIEEVVLVDVDSEPASDPPSEESEWTGVDPGELDDDADDAGGWYLGDDPASPAPLASPNASLKSATDIPMALGAPDSTCAFAKRPWSTSPLSVHLSGNMNRCGLKSTTPIS